MLLALQVATVFLVSIAWAQTLAHALEVPGKLRLDREAYMVTQTIYYPGFTIAAGFGEAGGILATFALLLATDPAGPAFSLTVAALAALLAMHATYWVVTHPVNKFWVRDQEMSAAGAGFFGIGRRGRELAAAGDTGELWADLRRQWEYSHVARAVLAGVALVCLIVATAL